MGHAFGEDCRETISVKPKYKCQEYLFGNPNHIFSRVWLGSSHILAGHGLFLILQGTVPITTLIPLSLIALIAGFGTTIGAHRYWTHRSFKAKLPLRLLLVVFQTLALQYPLFRWCRDHRIHHKFVDTDADPYNSRLGFWYSQLGWHFYPENSSTKEKGETMDFSDLDNDPIVRFQTKYYLPLGIVIFFVIPISTVHFLFPSLTLYQLICLHYLWYIYSVHATGTVNSIAHIFGMKPYDTKINPTENILVSFLSLGEGFHNFHHSFPWDYKTSELGYFFSPSTLLLDFFAWLGQAYDLKSVSHEAVLSRVRRTGDVELHSAHVGNYLTRRTSQSLAIDKEKVAEKTTLPAWGWGDDVISQEDFDVTKTIS